MAVPTSISADLSSAAILYNRVWVNLFSLTGLGSFSVAIKLDSVLRVERVFLFFTSVVGRPSNFVDFS